MTMSGVLAVGLTATPLVAYESKDLPAVEAKVRIDYAGVRQLDSASFQSMLADREPVVVFDVREAAEFEVSRIGEARRVDPGQWSSTFLNRHAGDIAGKTVVFYCSVGVRSSKLAARVQEALKERGAKAVYNLEGGIFRWHNESRPLSTASGPTDAVHPYDDHWGGLIKRRELSVTRPPMQSQKP